MKTIASENSKNNYFKKLPNIVLIPWHLDNKHIRPYPYMGKREIFCGPKLKNEDFKERKFIRTSGRYFDIDEVLSQLSEDDQKIDLVFSVLEVSSTCFPENLSKIKCPKIALVADTHHLMYPISPIISYIKRENIEHMLIVAQPAHLHFFYEAGITHTGLLPRSSLNFEKVDNKKSGVTYIGKKWSSSHPRRSRMLQFLEKNLPKYNIPYNYYNRLPKLEWLKVLKNSKITVISSLNGQFTPQIYSCLFAGTLCFVDELSSQSLLYKFFEPGKHLITWRNFKDLLKKIIYYHNHPNEAETIAKAGKLQAEENFATTENLALSISEFVFENKIDPRLLGINDERCNPERIESPEYFDIRVRLYENIQELHRIHESLKLISITEKSLKISADLADLPRIRITHAFRSIRAKNEADHFFKSVGVNHQIKTVMVNKIQKSYSFDIGVVETPSNQADWKTFLRILSKSLKSNSLLWVLGKLTSTEKKILKREGFKPYMISKNSILLNIKKISRKICFQFWKMGFYPFPYITLKPAMELVPNLNVFLRGWQASFPFLY